MRNLLLLSFFFLCIFKTEKLSAQCAACEAPVQLITNGNFSQGNSGFTTSLSLGTGFFCPLCPEGTFGVGSFAFLFHSDFIGQDHTNPPNGQFFVANAAASEGQSVWCQTVIVEPNIDYTFSYWVRDVTNNSDSHPLAILQAYFNGIPEGNSIEAYGGWQQNTFIWNSGTNTSVEICLLNFQSNSGGNDFGLDDISLTGCHPVDVLYSADAGLDVEVCSNESFTIGTANNSGYNYNWSSTPALSGLTNNGIQNLQISNETGVDLSYELTLTSDSASLGCVTSDNLTLTIHPVVPVDLPESNPLCPGDFYIASLDDIWESISWSDGTSGSTFSTSQAGTVQVIVTQNGCTATDQVDITLVELPEIDLGSDMEICETSVPFSLEYSINLNWPDGSNSSTYSVSTSSEVIASYSISNCTASDTISISVFEMPIAQLLDVYTFCEGSSVLVENVQAGNWSNGTFGTSTETDEEGILSILVENGPCMTVDGAQIQMRTIPEVDLGPDISICEGESLLLEAYSEMANAYLWSNDSVGNQIRISDQGYYDVIVSNECGSSSDEILLQTELCGWGLYIPNAFTPDENGINDGWSVQGYNITNLKVFVYNRFGDLIWYTEQLNDAWNPNQKTIGDDAYNYRVEAINYNGENIIRHGYVQLLK